MSESLHSRAIGGDFFAAANSGRGFISFYDSVFTREGIEKRYLIKGGPGTGKSSLMRGVAERAEAEELEVEYYRCSSDPDSLDGIIIGGRVALIDATAPHEFSPRLVGAEDEIVDLGAFWSVEGLERERCEIGRLSAQKAQSYARAYDILGAADRLESACARLAEPLIDRKKIGCMAESLLRGIPSGRGGAPRIALRDSVGMKGRVRLDGYERLAERVIGVRDICGCGGLLLEELLRGAVSRGLSVRVSYDPISLSRPDGILIEDTSTAIVIGTSVSEVAREVNMRRAVLMSGDESKRIRREYKRLKRICSQLAESAAAELRNSGAAHFALERIYAGYMDFESVRRFCLSFAETVVQRAAR